MPKDESDPKKIESTKDDEVLEDEDFEELEKEAQERKKSEETEDEEEIEDEEDKEDKPDEEEPKEKRDYFNDLDKKKEEDQKKEEEEKRFRDKVNGAFNHISKLKTKEEQVEAFDKQPDDVRKELENKFEDGFFHQEVEDKENKLSEQDFRRIAREEQSRLLNKEKDRQKAIARMSELQKEAGISADQFDRDFGDSYFKDFDRLVERGFSETEAVEYAFGKTKLLEKDDSVPLPSGSGEKVQKKGDYPAIMDELPAKYR